MVLINTYSHPNYIDDFDFIYREDFLSFSTDVPEFYIDEGYAYSCWLNNNSGCAIKNQPPVGKIKK